MLHGSFGDVVHFPGGSLTTYFFIYPDHIKYVLHVIITITQAASGDGLVQAIRFFGLLICVGRFGDVGETGTTRVSSSSFGLFPVPDETESTLVMRRLRIVPDVSRPLHIPSEPCLQFLSCDHGME